TMGHPLPVTYCSAVECGSTPFSNEEELAEEIRRGETMMLGLRLLTDGVSRRLFAERHGVSLDDWFDTPLRTAIRNGMMEETEDGVRLTPRGLMLANDVCGSFL
ncbi:MAG: coproporphyrinogen III oxidase family protein, partial [Chloroflexota bacterium]